ncbi:MAG: FAD-dependent oxidoreductase [Candidatus Omnitrophota bacterium]|nr:FAD-dependent oxidoreductase [Candidatus Omnitrophota bacterium]
MYDLIIIGAGPAGITAAVYAARKRMELLVISEDIGGQTAWSGNIENYTGYQFISGPELAAKFEEHLRKFSIQLKENETVQEVKKAGDRIRVQAKKGEYEARTVIIASGKKSRELNVPGEREFKNHGLTYCATCDGPLFTGKEVVVIGGGNSALDAALQLIKIARHTTVLNIAAALTGDPVMQEQIVNIPQVTVLNNSRVTAVLGDKMVTGIRFQQAGKEEQLPVQGVFVEIGLIPNSYLAPELAKNELGEIKVDCDNATNIPGIFAAGDVTDVTEKQIIIAAGEGSKAALNAFRYLIQHKAA